MSQSIEELLDRFGDAVGDLEYSPRDEDYLAATAAARSDLLTRYKELEATEQRQAEALEMFRDEQSRDKARIADINDRIMQDTRDLEHHVAEIWRLRSRIAELEAECCEAEDVGYSCTEPAGHSGFHVASGLPRPYHTWPAS